MVRWDRAATGAATVVAVVMLAACGDGERKTESRGETQTAEVTATEATQETAEATDVETQGEGAGGGSFTDPRDNKTYRTVRIGNLTWMAENLNFETADSWCYDNSPAECDKYGRLYTWSAAMSGSSTSSANPSGVQGVCPAGWHLPSNAEWDVLVTAAGGWSSAGGKLKSSSGWNSSGNGDDDFGFSALPGGGRNSDGYFYFAGIYGHWWSSTENDGAYAWYRSMYYRYDYVYESIDDKLFGMSVRCVRD